MSHIIIVVVVTIIMWFFSKVAKNSKAIETAGGEYVLSYSNVIKWFCMGLTIFGVVGLTALVLKYPIKDDGDLVALVSMYAALLLFGVYFYIEFFTVKILVSEAGVKAVSGWRGKREYLWDEIESIIYSPTIMWFKVTSSKSSSLRIHALISGIDNFRKFYVEKLSEEKWIKAHKKYGQDKRANR